MKGICSAIFLFPTLTRRSIVFEKTPQAKANLAKRYSKQIYTEGSQRSVIKGAPKRMSTMKAGQNNDSNNFSQYVKRSQTKHIKRKENSSLKNKMQIGSTDMSVLGSIQFNQMNSSSKVTKNTQNQGQQISSIQKNLEQQKTVNSRSELPKTSIGHNSFKNLSGTLEGPLKPILSKNNSKASIDGETPMSKQPLSSRHDHTVLIDVNHDTTNSQQFFRRLRKGFKAKYKTKFMNKKQKKMILRSLEQGEDCSPSVEDSSKAFRINKGFRTKRSSTSRRNISKSNTGQLVTQSVAMTLGSPAIYQNKSSHNKYPHFTTLSSTSRTKRSIEFYESQLNLICGVAKKRAKKLNNGGSVGSGNPYTMTERGNLSLRSKNNLYRKGHSKAQIKAIGKQWAHSSKQIKVSLKRKITAASNSTSTVGAEPLSVTARFGKRVEARGGRSLKFIGRRPSVDPYLKDC